MNIETRIRKSIRQRKGTVFSRSDLASFGSQSQVSYVICKLIDKGEVLRISKGIYAKAKSNGRGVETCAPPDQVVRDAIKKLGLKVYENELSRIKEKTTIYVESKSNHVDRLLEFNGIKVRVNSHKAKIKDNVKNSFIHEDVPTKNIKEYIFNLAKMNNVSYSYKSIDQFADSVTSLAGDDIRSDKVEDLIVALKRAGKLSMKQVALLSINYIRERNASL